MKTIKIGMVRTVAAALALCAGTVAFAGPAKTNVWVTLGAGNWSDAKNWENGEKPSTDGTALVVITNSLTSTGASITINVDENASVWGIRYLQGKATSYAPVLAGSKTLTIGAGGIYGKSYGSLAVYTSTNGRQMDVNCPVVLATSQIWQDNINGLGHGDWVQWTSGAVTGAADVNWMLAAMKHTVNWSKSSFLGTLYPQKSVCFCGKEKFDYVPKIVLCSTNCFGYSATSADPRISFRFTGNGTATNSSEIVFDCETSGSATPYIGVPSTSPLYENKLVFTGKWSGHNRGYGNGPCFTGNYDVYGNGHMYSNSGDGMFRPSTLQLWFDNDMSGLVQDNKSTQIGDIIIVLKHKNAWKNMNFFLQKGRCGRLKGVLTTNGRNFSNAINVYEWAYPTGATALFGIAEAGYAKFSGLTIGGTQSGTDGGEKPVWFYAPDGGTVDFNGGFSYSWTGVHYLPFQVWGGGTVIMSVNQSMNGNSPVWVRDGRLVVGGTDSMGGVHNVNLKLGVSHPSTIAVRALQMAETSPTYSSDYQTLTYSSVPKPDGVTLKAGDRVLLNCPVGTTAPMYNGVYVVGENTKVWTRAPEMNDPAQCAPDIRVTVEAGSYFKGTSWFLHNESRRICDRVGKAYTLTFNSADYCVAFVQEPHVNPDVALLAQSGRTMKNKIDIVDNQSSGESILGAYDASAVKFTGAITNLKDRLTFTAPAGGSASFTGTFCGTNAVKKTGAGTIALSPSDATLAITNLVIESGTLSVAAKCLHKDLKTVEFAFTNGVSALELTGDVDLDGWTFRVTGLTKPADRKNPPSLDVSVTSKDGTVSGTPTVVLEGDNTRRWTATREGNVWKVRRPCQGTVIYVGDGVK